MEKSIYLTGMLLDMNERLFINALEGLTEEQAGERISGHNNPLIWIATHTAWARYNMLIFLGKPAKNPYAGLFENFRAYDPLEAYPTLEAVKTAWKNASSLLKNALQTVTQEVLAGDSPVKSPIGDPTNGGTISFLAQHESYSIGQIAFLKKYYTNEAMKYN